jgi:hypothetical protein
MSIVGGLDIGRASRSRASSRRCGAASGGFALDLIRPETAELGGPTRSRSHSPWPCPLHSGDFDQHDDTLENRCHYDHDTNSKVNVRRLEQLG